MQVESEPDLEMDLAPTHCGLDNVTCPHLTTVSLSVKWEHWIIQSQESSNFETRVPWIALPVDLLPEWGSIHMDLWTTRLFMPDVAVRWLWSMDCKSTLTCPQKQSPFQLLISPPFSPVSARFLFWPPLSPSTPLSLVDVLNIDSTTILAPAVPTQYPSLPALLWSELVGGKGRGEGRENGLSCTVRLVPRTWCWAPELWGGPIPLWVAPTAAAIHFLDFRQIPWRPTGIPWEFLFPGSHHYQLSLSKWNWRLPPPHSLPSSFPSQVKAFSDPLTFLHSRIVGCVDEGGKWPQEVEGRMWAWQTARRGHWTPTEGQSCEGSCVGGWRINGVRPLARPDWLRS